MSLFNLGEVLLANMRTAIAAHSVSVERDYVSGTTTVGPFAASSPPIGHQLLSETGLDLSDQDRTFFFNVTDMGVLGEPRIGDVIIDHKDDSRWRVLPQNSEYGWSWHGQHRQQYKVLAKQD